MGFNLGEFGGDNGHLAEVAQRVSVLQSERREKTMGELRCYDPRKGEEVETDNPVIIFAHMVRNTGGLSLLEPEEEASFWEKIIKLADYCDEKVEGNDPEQRDDK